MAVEISFFHPRVLLSFVFPQRVRNTPTNKTVAITIDYDQRKQTFRGVSNAGKNLPMKYGFLKMLEQNDLSV